MWSEISATLCILLPGNKNNDTVCLLCVMKETRVQTQFMDLTTVAICIVVLLKPHRSCEHDFPAGSNYTIINIVRDFAASEGWMLFPIHMAEDIALRPSWQEPNLF